MIPVYGFLQGDTLGILVFTYKEETIEDLMAKLQRAASVRVKPRENMAVVYEKHVLDLKMTVGQVGIDPLARFDVIERNSYEF